LCDVGLAEAIGSSYATVDGTALVRGLGVAGFATHTLVPEGSVVKIPKEADLELAALIGCALSTGVGAVFRTAKVTPGSSVAVVGCGGVGLCVMQGAKIAGASKIIAVDRLAPKLELARSLGATDVVDASAGDPVEAVKAATGGRGADYTFEVVGISQTIKQSFAMTRRGGTTVLVGAGSDKDEVTFNALDLFLDAKTLIGCVYGSTDPDRDFPVLVEMIERGAIDARALVTKRIGLEDINDALDSMEAGVGARSLVVFE
jgi:S-(hydroxymethyl)glutathione dehydrogenase/alcohol dehydrogenase